MSSTSTRSVITTLHTDGCGFWSSCSRAVDIVELQLIEHSQNFGELRVCFNTVDWNTVVDGFIYTDKLFMNELRSYLKSIGLDSSDVNYSEQGMQGHTYVSCDVGKCFIESVNCSNPIAGVVRKIGVYY